MNIRKLRGEIAMRYRSQAAFANAIGWHCNKISKMMNGKYIPDVDEAAKIALTLGLNEHQYCDIFLSSKSPNGDLEAISKV